MIRVACLGAGYFSRFHLDGWARAEGAVVVGVADLVKDKAAATGYPAYHDVDQLLKHTRPDVLDIILPPHAQAAAVRSALDVGLRAIVCQKPFCTSLAEAEDTTALAEAAGVPLIVHENFRFQPWYRVIRDGLSAGDIGTVLQANFRLRPGDGQGPDAYLDRQPYFQTMPRFLVHETAVHWIETFRFLFGNPTAVYADLRRVNPVIAGEDAGLIVFEHPKDVRAVFDGNRALDHAARDTRCTMGEGVFEGTEGSLQLWGDGSVWHRRFGEVDAKNILAADSSGQFGGDCAYLLQQHVLEGLNGGRPFENTAREYLAVTRIEEAIYRSAASGRKIKLGGAL